jgi:hypothetical protein
MRLVAVIGISSTYQPFASQDGALPELTVRLHETKFYVADIVVGELVLPIQDRYSGP